MLCVVSSGVTGLHGGWGWDQQRGTSEFQTEGFQKLEMQEGEETKGETGEEERRKSRGDLTIKKSED